MEDLNKVQEFFSKPLEENTTDWPKEVPSRHGDIIFRLVKVMPDRAKYELIDAETGKTWEVGGRVYGTVNQLKASAENTIKPQGGRQSSQFESVNESPDVNSLKKIHDAVLKFLKTKKGVGEVKEFPEFPNRYGDNVSTFSVKYNIEDKYNYDLQEIKIEYSTSRVFIPNNGYFPFKTFNDIKNIINKKSSLKESVNEGKTYKKGDKLKIKLKNGKEFDLTFDSYGRQKGMAFGKFKDGSGEYDTKPFNLDTIVESVNEELTVNENVSQEVINKVSRFITSMANYYDYSEQDAVYAIMQALRSHKGNFQGLNEIEGEDKIDIITMDVPLFIRILEYSREDAQEDMDLHELTEKAIKATKQQGILQMDDYDMLVGEPNELNEGAVEIMDSYNRILDLLKKESRSLNDDDSYALGLKLRAWFEKNIIKESYDEPFVDPNQPEKKPGQKYDKNKFANLMGRKVVYSAIPGTVIYADENILKLKDKNGNIRKINYNMFTNQGFIKEILSNL